MRSRTPLVLGTAAVTVIAIACGQQPAPSPTPAQNTRPAPQRQTAARNTEDYSETPATPTARGARGGQGGFGGAAQQGATNPQPYGRVVTAQAKTKSGLFKVHTIGDRLLFEIPRNQLDKDILLVQEIAQTALGAGYDGQAAGNRMLRFERRENKVMLRGISNEIMASDTLSPVAGAVSASNVHPIIAIFNVEAYGPDSAPVIDVTRLFTQPPTELSPAQRIGAGYQVDATRSFIERSASFPDNVNVYSTLTLQQGNNAGRGAATTGRGGPGAGRGAAGFNAPTATIVASYSFHKLPDVPMEPRLCDNRVGYFSLTVTDYAGDDQRMASNTRCFITRYRLEKKDPSAAVSDPVKPIVYYLDANTPVKWRPWLKKAIEDWQPAFEAAGFSHAIIAKDAPTNDPDWSPEDARYSVVRWLPSTTENASGPNIHDPRSGEILNAHIQFYQNVQNLARTWYFTQVAALDPRARQFPFPDSLMGRLLEYVLAHEVGHTIGFQHNMKASSQYPIDSIRNADFLRRMGHVSTLMDYSRFNYVAQPEDHIPAEMLIPKIGPYDIWATHWGYAPIATPMQVAQQGATHTGAELIRAAEAKEVTLDKWAREQDAKPWLRFSTSGAFGSDPGDETEAVGDIDPVRATDLGFRNLKRNMEWIESATVKPTDDFGVLAELYGREIGQFRTELGHVANLVGGMNSQEKYGDQPGVRFTPVPKAKQAEAMKFIADNGFRTPTWLIDTDILRKTEPDGEVMRIVGAQSSIITSLLNDAKMTRLIENEALTKNPSDVYTLTDMLGDLRHGVFTEIYGSGPVKIDVYRRGLQRAYLKDVGDKINPPANGAAAAGRGGAGSGRGGAAAPPANTGEIKSMLRGELKALDAELSSAQKRATDVETKRHIDDARQQISHIIRPAAAASNGEAADEEGNLTRWP